MKKKCAVLILLLPTLSVLALVFFTLSFGFPADRLATYFGNILFVLVCFTISGIPAYAWLLAGIVGFGVGARLLLTSQSCGRIRLGVALSMIPVLAIILAFFFTRYRGP